MVVYILRHSRRARTRRSHDAGRVPVGWEAGTRHSLPALRPFRGHVLPALGGEAEDPTEGEVPGRDGDGCTQRLGGDELSQASDSIISDFAMVIVVV